MKIVRYEEKRVARTRLAGPKAGQEVFYIFRDGGKETEKAVLVIEENDNGVFKVWVPKKGIIYRSEKGLVLEDWAAELADIRADDVPPVDGTFSSGKEADEARLKSAISILEVKDGTDNNKMG